MKAIVPAWKAHSLSQNWFNDFDQVFDSFFEKQSNHNYELACDVEESEQYLLFSFDFRVLRINCFSISLIVTSVSREDNSATLSNVSSSNKKCFG